MKFLSIDHLCLDVRNMDVSFDFYTAKLGFSEYMPSNVQGGVKTVFLSSGGVTIDLKSPVTGKVGGSQSERNVVGVNHIALKVDDIHKAYEELVKRGVEFEKKPAFMAHSNRWIAIFKDPDGNVFHLVQ